MTNKAVPDSTPTLERDHHMGILRQWGTATPMWAVEYIQQLEAALDASGNDELVEALEIAALGFEKHSRHWQASAERTSLIEDKLRAENAQALADAMRAAIARQRPSQ